MKPLISNKWHPSENKTLVKGDHTKSDKDQFASIFYEIFANSITKLA